MVSPIEMLRRPSSTDSDGKFLFKDLAPGRYRVIASANGYVRHEYGQRIMNASGSPIDLAAGQTVKDAVLTNDADGLSCAARISIISASLRSALPSRSSESRTVLRDETFQPVAGPAQTTEENIGLYGLTPGAYYLVAGMASGPMRPPIQEAGQNQITAGRTRSLSIRACRMQLRRHRLRSGAEASPCMT